MKIVMAYFTGTGFTARAAGKLKEGFEALGHEVRMRYIPDLMRGYKAAGAVEAEALGEFERLGILYPIHSFNAPELVVRFAKLLPPGDGREAFLIATAGGRSSLNDGSAALLKRVLRGKGYQAAYEEILQMPSNFLSRHDDVEAAALIRHADALAPVIAEEIVKGRKKQAKPSPATRLVGGLGRSEWVGAHLVGRFHLKASEACNQCGRCVRDCPTDNIRLDGKSVRFGSGCTFCMRCIYNCPKRAIHLRKPFGKIEIENWYDLDRLLEER